MSRFHSRLWMVMLAAMVIVPGVAWSRLSQPDAPASPSASAAKLATRFVSVDIYVDSGEAALAAYQVEFLARPADGAPGDVKLVGIEGGGVKGAAFSEPPEYDPRALNNRRVILAEFSLLAADKLPKGKTRVARLHLMIEGDEAKKPEYSVNLIAAGRPEGVHIDAKASVVEGEGQ